MDRIFAENVAEKLKLNAYKEVQSDYDAAKSVLVSKKLAFGEQSCVPFYYPNADAENKEVMLLIGYGGLDGKTYFFSNVLDPTSDVSEASVYVEDTSTFMSVTDAFSYVNNKMTEMKETIERQFENTSYAIHFE